jgi:hypothetical protein
MKRVSFFVFAVVILCIAACSSREDEPSSVSSASQAITGTETLTVAFPMGVAFSDVAVSSRDYVRIADRTRVRRAPGSTGPPSSRTPEAVRSTSVQTRRHGISPVSAPSRCASEQR